MMTDLAMLVNGDVVQQKPHSFTEPDVCTFCGHHTLSELGELVSKSII